MAGYKKTPKKQSRTGGKTPPSRLHVRLKTKKSLSQSSKEWLERQINDPYVAEAKRLGYRSRAAFKLLQLQEKFAFLRKGATVIDLGAAPGGWAQVAARIVGPSGNVIALDLLPIQPLEGVTCLQLDFLSEEAPHNLRALLKGPVHAVLSDMAPSTIGHTATDHLRILNLAEAALDFAQQVLAPQGVFIAKVFQGGSERTLLERLKKHFEKVRHIKPPASRSESSELYVVATGFKG